MLFEKTQRSNIFSSFFLLKLYHKVHEGKREHNCESNYKNARVFEKNSVTGKYPVCEQDRYACIEKTNEEHFPWPALSLPRTNKHFEHSMRNNQLPLYSFLDASIC